MRAAVVRSSIRCASAPAQVWRVVTDTERLNRAAGMGAITLSPIDGAGAARYLATTRLDGFGVAYEERPFEWKEPERFSIRRKMRAGPLRELAMRYELTPDGDGCVVTAELWIEPKLRLLVPLVRRGAARTVARLLEEVARADEAMRSERPLAPPPSKQVRPDALDRAQRALAEVVDPELARRLADHVLRGEDADLARIRPYELADAWKLARRALLTACLHAVPTGLLELRWDLVCPSCRTAAATMAHLAEVGAEGHCHLCDLTFGVELDRSIEAVFAPNVAVRPIDAGPYCIGGPARTPHVVAQMILAPNATRELDVPAREGRYRLFVRGDASALVEVAAGGPARVEVVAGRTLEPASLAIAPEGVLAVENRAPEERHAKLERTEWSSLAATAHEVSALGPFRRLFSHETVRPGLALKVARVGLFFSDLTGSTALYTRVGDAAAFRLVQDHFEVIGGAVEARGGALVKTIGDAVMASFTDELAGLEAALDVLEAFERFRTGRDDCDGVHVKLGFFAGPSYVVDANGALDYFGQTVNIAARLQAKAESAELVLDRSLYDRATEAGGLTRGEVVERFDAKLKGIERPLACVRLRLAARGPEREPA